ncbi:MAG: J domain-containing protein [Cyanobacteriota/Melainabacteria group bacterium]
MNKLHEAYKILELPPGADWAAVKKKYRFLSTVWHPDRMANEDFKKQAEEKLKAINHARDVLKNHFDTGHRDSDCDCQEQDPEIYKEKEQEARDRFHREQEERRRATEAEERQAKARDEARKQKQEEERRRQTQEDQAAATREAVFATDIAAAYDQAKRLQDHEAYLKYTIQALKVFLATGVILAINLGIVSMASNHLKGVEPWQEKDYYEKRQQYLEDKEAYLKAHIDKSMGGYAGQLQQPFNDSYMKILEIYRYPPKPKPAPMPYPVHQEPVLTQQDRNDIANLEGQYITRANYIGTKEKLQNMLSKLHSAMGKTSESRIYDELNEIYKPTLALLQAAETQIETLNRSIAEKEERVVRRLGRSYLPDNPSIGQSDNVITESAFNNAVSVYPELFKGGG